MTQNISPEVRPSATRIASTTRCMSPSRIICHQLPDAPPPPKLPPPPLNPPDDPDHVESDQSDDPEPEPHGSGTKTGPPVPRRAALLGSRALPRETLRMIMM